AIACLLADPDSHGCSLPQKVTSADLQSEPVVLIDMIAQKLMQPLPEDILDLAESEPRINLPRDPVTFVALPVFLTQPVETFLDFCGATDERARHLLAHDEELGNQPGLQALAIDSVVTAISGNGPQDGRPLVIVDAAADFGMFGQQHVIFHVENARRIVASLDEGAEPREVVAVTPQHGGNRAAGEEQRAILHPVEKTVKAAASDAGFVPAGQRKPG